MFVTNRYHIANVRKKSANIGKQTKMMFVSIAENRFKISKLFPVYKQGGCSQVLKEGVSSNATHVARPTFV